MKNNYFKKETCEALYRELDDAIKASSKGPFDISMLWAPHIEKLIREYQEKKDFKHLARIYEMVAAMEINLNKDGQEDILMQGTALYCACCYYYAANQDNLAQLVASRGFADIIENYHARYSNIQNYTLEELMIEKEEQMQNQEAYEEDERNSDLKEEKLSQLVQCALCVEVLGDICIFIDQGQARYYYNRSRELFEKVCQVDEDYIMYETGQFYWWVPQGHHGPASQLCLDLKIHNDGKLYRERLELKERFLESNELNN